MAHRGRRNANDALALALAAGKTLRDAANEVGIGERTATRRWADPEFRKLVSRHRGDMAGRVGGEVADAMADAVQTLRELLDTDYGGAIRLSAARSLLKIGIKAGDILELDECNRAIEVKMLTIENTSSTSK